MPNIFSSFIGIQPLIVCFLIIINMVEAESSKEVSLISSPNYRYSHLQNNYPVVHNQKLTNNMLSLLRNLRRKRSKRRRQFKKQRKGAFIVHDLEGNPMLVVRKQRTKNLKDQPRYANQPGVYDPQNLASAAPGPIPNVQGLSNFNPYQQFLQSIPSNSGAQRPPAYPSVVVPQSENMQHLQPNAYNAEKGSGNDLTTDEAVILQDYDYYDDFELIPLSSTRSKSILTVDPPVTHISTKEPTTSSAISGSSTTKLQSSEFLKQTLLKKLRHSNQPHGLLSAVSELTSALEQMFVVPCESNSYNVKRESTSSPADTSTQTLISFATPSTSVDRTTINSPSIIEGSTNLAFGPFSPIIPSPMKVQWDFHSNKDKILQSRLGLIHPIAFKTLTSTTKSQAISPFDEQDMLKAQFPVSPTQVQNDESKIVNEEVSDLSQEFPSLFKNSQHEVARHKLEDNSSSNSNMIEKILEIVENIRVQAKESNIKEDLPCNLTGSWSTLAGGVLLKISYHNESLNISLHPKIPPSPSGFLRDPAWKLKISKPFSKTGMIIVTGANRKCKHALSFIGECRNCGGGDIISGNWLIARSSRNCKDQRASQQLLSDVWSRETLTQRCEERLQRIKDHHAGAKKRVKTKKKGDGSC